ncbi:nucleolar protein dao-5-like isoform X2 [Thalassophryne amazonica]|uniref:nucleolar protein dao-5-like isoform X2 n=1 Tax=Thalassophryne amazonica TaxID=390379 RepID=UPI001471718A|nr:nucleolar protein dao-5-like isoform X2 [Thalassophryne amazonica]
MRATTSKQARKAHMPGSSCNRTDAETINRAAAHPHVTKDLRVSLIKCRAEEADLSGDHNKTRIESEDESSSMSADDEPLLKLKTSLKSLSKQKTSSQSKQPLKRNDKLLKECSSDTDDEPLSKKKRLKVQLEVTYSSDGKKTKRGGNKLLKEHSDESTDDEPLAKKRTGLKASDNKKSKSTPGCNLLKVNYTEDSAESAEHSAKSTDDEPLAKKRTGLKASDNKKSKSTPRRNLLKINYSEHSAESADDEPLAKRRTGLKASPHNKKPKSARGHNLLKVNYAESSSDDEPLSKMKRRIKAPAGLKRSTDRKKIKRGHDDKLLKGSKSNRSHDETLMKAAHPQVTMDLKVCLTRCPVEEADPSGDVNKSGTEPPNVQGLTGTKCHHSEESAEET